MGIYDVFKKLPIAYYPIPKKINAQNIKTIYEPDGFLNNLHLFTDNDVLIFDAIYYSENFFKKITDKNIGALFRMKKNSKLFKGMKVGTSKFAKVCGKNVQLFKYNSKNTIVYLLTTITDPITISEIKALYKKRWEVEKHFREFKYDILKGDIRSKNENSFIVDILSVQCSFILISILQELINKTYVDKKLNFSNFVQSFFRNLLCSIFYKSDNINEICRLLNIVLKKLVDVVYGRSNERKKIKPSTKWNQYGNRYGNRKGIT